MTSFLGDFFSKEIKRNFAENNIEFGSALLIRISEFTVPYPKYIIIISENSVKDIFGYVVINTVINENLFPSSYLKSLHIKIDKLNHNFLEYDSFIDCTKIREFTKKEVIDFIIEKPERLVGIVSDGILKKIHNTLTYAKTIDGATKKKFGFF